MRTRHRFVLCLVVALVLTACGAGGGTSGTAATSAPAAEPTAAAAPTAAPAQPTEAPPPTEAPKPTEAAAPTAMPEPTAAGGTSASGTIKIGVMGPFTGPAASIGQEQLNFAKLAVEDFNKANGTKIELVEGDTQLDPAKATDVATRLSGDADVYVIVGPAGSQEVLAVQLVLEKANLAFVSPSATRTDLTEKSWKNFFRVVPRDDVQGSTDANFMVDQLKAKKVWIIDDQSAYATGLRDEVSKVLKDKGVAVTTESITQKDNDFSSLVTKIKGDQPDVVFIPWQLAPQASVLAKQMAEQGVTATLFGADGLFDSEKFIKDAAGATDGAYVSFFAPDVSSVDAAKPVVEAYKAKYGGQIGPFGAPTYVAVMAALEAVQRAQKGGTLSREAVLAELPKTADASSILGIPIKFDAKGDIQGASFFLFQVKDGKFSLVTKST
jgi:branched-chain amino acid transport system substrate-binding protein